MAGDRRADEHVDDMLQRARPRLPLSVGQVRRAALAVGEFPLERLEHVPDLAQRQGPAGPAVDDVQRHLEGVRQLAGQGLVDADQGQVRLLADRADNRGEEHRERDLPRAPVVLRIVISSTSADPFVGR